MVGWSTFHLWDRFVGRRAVDAVVDPRVSRCRAIHPYSIPTTARHGADGGVQHDTRSGCISRSEHWLVLDGQPVQTMDIFEGTEQIQELVISRAISGLRIE